MKVEPFVHYKTAEVMNLNAAASDYAAKLYFSEWLSMMNDGYILVTPAEKLRLDLAAYTVDKAAAIAAERKALEQPTT
jgi:hypothetical protein